MQYGLASQDSRLNTLKMAAHLPKSGVLQLLRASLLEELI